MKGAAVAADTVRRPPPGVVVLIYHRVARVGHGARPARRPLRGTGGGPGRLGLVVPLGDALERLAGPVDGGGTGTGGDPVVITFDDGTVDFVEHALPILERHGLPATLYAATAFIEEGRPFPGDGRPVSWRALADARVPPVWSTWDRRTGTRCSTGCLPTSSTTSSCSIELIGERLGRPPLDFAYPKALAGSDAADRAVRRRFRSGGAGRIATQSARCHGPVPAGSVADPAQRRHALVPAQARRWHGGRGGLRRLINRWRLGATT